MQCFFKVLKSNFEIITFSIPRGNPVIMSEKGKIKSLLFKGDRIGVKLDYY